MHNVTLHVLQFVASAAALAALLTTAQIVRFGPKARASKLFQLRRATAHRG